MFLVHHYNKAVVTLVKPKNFFKGKQSARNRWDRTDILQYRDLLTDKIIKVLE